MRIVIFGASGKVGQLVVNEALRRGHIVTAFVHSSSLKPRRNLTLFQGDIYDRTSVEKALPGHRAIISALGSWGTKEKNVLSTAMQKIVPGAKAAGISRIVSLTGNVAQAPGEKSSLKANVARALLGAAQPKILRDGEDHIAILAASQLNWTVVRSPVMTNKYETQYVLNADSASPTISRQAVAEALVDLAENGEWSRKAPFIRRV